ncbi:hypothetical protein Micbo1qcDRAFT_220748 [Microdochium bolleyi]|uniref:Uncharacterized protein n=1 Tax=Microdochium bolleyi TaxID=196109 RepID=A0A136JAG0_9PEZI|nr:hypothetical protein Micbo1qcDRAFT_220748 [Microdochium bolleyi]
MLAAYWIRTPFWSSTAPIDTRAMLAMKSMDALCRTSETRVHRGGGGLRRIPLCSLYTVLKTSEVWRRWSIDLKSCLFKIAISRAVAAITLETTFRKGRGSSEVSIANRNCHAPSPRAWDDNHSIAPQLSQEAVSYCSRLEKSRVCSIGTVSVPRRSGSMVWPSKGMLDLAGSPFGPGQLKITNPDALATDLLVPDVQGLDIPPGVLRIGRRRQLMDGYRLDRILRILLCLSLKPLVRMTTVPGHPSGTTKTVVVEIHWRVSVVPCGEDSDQCSLAGSSYRMLCGACRVLL